MKNLHEQIKKLQERVDALEKILELEYLIKTKVESRIYNNPKNKLNVNITDITNNESLLGGII